MALSTMDAIVAALASGAQRLTFGRSNNYSPNHTAFINAWVTGAGDWAGNPGVGVLSSVSSGLTNVVGGPAPTANFSGFQFSNPGGSNKLYLAAVQAQANQPGLLMIYDRVSTYRTLGAGSTATTGLTVPADPDPRWYAGGRGVELWYEQFILNAFTVAATATYTNDAGTGSQVSPSLSVAANLNGLSMFRMPLAAGDVGVRSVQSVTISGGAPGNHSGLTLVKHIATLPVGGAACADLFDFARLGLPEVAAAAGLAVAFAPQSAAGGVVSFSGSLVVVEG